VIVLDENLDEQRVRKPIALRHRGKVCSIRDLRPGSVIKDEAIPSLLIEHRATFLTSNAADFWRCVSGHPRYCVICFPVPNERQSEIPSLFLALHRHPHFRTERQRLGKILRVTSSDILFYEGSRAQITRLTWP